LAEVKKRPLVVYNEIRILPMRAAAFPVKARSNTTGCSGLSPGF